MSLTETAVHYAELGFSVFPARFTPMLIKGEWKPMKVPHTIHGHLQASSEPSEVERLFEGTHENIKPKCSDKSPDIIGLLHDKFLVVDVDVKHGKPGLENFEKIKPKLPKPLAKVQTSSSGLHWYYPAPPKDVLSKRSTDFLPGVDLLIGKGWVAAPASVGYTLLEGSMEDVASTFS